MRSAPGAETTGGYMIVSMVDTHTSIITTTTTTTTVDPTQTIDKEAVEEQTLTKGGLPGTAFAL
jgi:hypothetical protein